MIKKSLQAMNAFEKLLQAEKELLFECETEAGFFERLAISFIQFLRTNPVSSSAIAKWQETCVDMTLIVRANEQMKVAFLELWEHAKKTGNTLLKRELVQIFRKVKGPSPHVEISSWGLPRVIAFALRPLYAEHIVKTDAFLFAPAEYEIQKKNKEFHALADNDPSFLWIHMITLENCRAFKNVSFLSLCWETLRGDKATMGIRAYEAMQKYSVAMAAGDLRSLGFSESKPYYFIRKDFERYVNRLCMVILFELSHTYTDSAPKDRNLGPQKQIDTRVDDRAIGTEKMRGYFEKNPKAKLDQVTKWLDGEVRKGNVTLSSPKEISTYKQWIREAGLQPLEAKVRGKDKQPRNAHSN